MGDNKSRPAARWLLHAEMLQRDGAGAASRCSGWRVIGGTAARQQKQARAVVRWSQAGRKKSLELEDEAVVRHVWDIGMCCL